MKRRPLVAGNWKMNMLYQDAQQLFGAINEASASLSGDVDIMIAPPGVYLRWFVKDSTARVTVGAQDVSHREESQGAFTGEMSAAILESAGIEYAIVGHSERRAYHGETDEIIQKKIQACVKAGLAPVYCCGENLDERESGRHFDVVRKQISTALNGFTAGELSKLVIAYEPVWAIGTGKTASSEQAQEMHAEIRKLISGLFGESYSKSLRILYGGSCKPSNAKEIFSQPDVDGGLIGGAALNAADFLDIIRAAS